MSELSRMAHRSLAPDHVVVPAADASSLEEAGLGEVGHDPLNCTLGDPDVFGEVAKAHVRIPGDTQQNLSVVGEECPALPRGVS
jgi:hypothetical protein